MRFARQANTAIGRALFNARIAFVARHYSGSLLDVGIGSGEFILRRPEFTCGYDINPIGVKWLKDRKLWADPYLVTYPLSMWDVLEHIDDFVPLLENCREWLFLSLPIFRDATHALGSKHFRPKEHVWYFTRDGLEWIMSRLGFALIECNDEETKIGREDIMSFAFQRMK